MITGYNTDIRHGNPQPRVTEVVGGMLSSIGIPSKGPEHYLAEVVPFYARYTPPLIASATAAMDTLSGASQRL